MIQSYKLHFAARMGEEVPGVIVAQSDAAAIKIAVSLKLLAAFELWQEQRFVKLD